jgi:TM2 domain-containing membrane protein YozV
MTQGPEVPPPPPYGQPGWPVPPAGAYGVSSTTPYGIHPMTGIPYSDKSKLVAGLLQILIPIGIGRFYIGDTRTGVLQLVLSLCFVGMIWAFVDGIIMLVTDSKDANGYMLRS